MHAITRVFAAVAFGCMSLSAAAQTPPSILDADLGGTERVLSRASIVSRPGSQRATHVLAMTPAQRRAAVDAVWGPGFSPQVSLEIFDRFWNYVDTKFAAFQGISVDWAALRDRYRPEVAAGVSRGRLAGIINHMSLTLRDGHTIPLDLVVNATLPQPGVPLLAVGDWIFNTAGACMTAQDDGSALVYDVVPGHPLGLQPGDRVLGYDGVPWPALVRQLIDEELPMWPLWWGSGQEGYEHVLVMSAGMNWHLFGTMDVYKLATGTTEHVPTSLLSGGLFSNFCSEQMAVAGISKPVLAADSLVRWGVIDGTRIGYINIWGWFGNAPNDFKAAVDDLTGARRVDALILDLRFNVGGLLLGPLSGLAALFDHPSTTIGMDERMRPSDHFKMKKLFPPSHFKVDFDRGGNRDKASFTGPIAVLVGPGALSAGDFSAIWAGYHPNVRLFGKSTAMAAGLPTQPALGTELVLHPEWFATVAETNSYRVGAPRRYLTHTDLPVDERVWLRPEDVAVGRDTVIEAARRWIGQ